MNDKTMTVDEAMRVADEVSPTPARARTALLLLKAEVLNRPSKATPYFMLLGAILGSVLGPLIWRAWSSHQESADSELVAAKMERMAGEQDNRAMTVAYDSFAGCAKGRKFERKMLDECSVLAMQTAATHPTVTPAAAAQAAQEARAAYLFMQAALINSGQQDH